MTAYQKVFTKLYQSRLPRAAKAIYFNLLAQIMRWSHDPSCGCSHHCIPLYNILLGSQLYVIIDISNYSNYLWRYPLAHETSPFIVLMYSFHSHYQYSHLMWIAWHRSVNRAHIRDSFNHIELSTEISRGHSDFSMKLGYIGSSWAIHDNVWWCSEHIHVNSSI